MKAVKSILILGFVIAILDATVLLVYKIISGAPTESVVNQLVKSLSVIGTLMLAALVITLVINALMPKQEE